MPKRLKTEKDGRLYAIALLQTLRDDDLGEQRSEGYSPHSAVAEGKSHPSGISIYRTKPQTDVIRRRIEELYRRGSQQAIAGFYVVLTDFIGSTLAGGVPDPELYLKKGECDPWGSVIYRDPKKAKAAIESGEGGYEINGGTITFRDSASAREYNALRQRIAGRIAASGADGAPIAESLVRALGGTRLPALAE